MTELRPVLALWHWLTDDVRAAIVQDFPGYDLVHAREANWNATLALRTVAAFGLPPLELLPKLTALRWLQLASAGVPNELCAPALARKLMVTNLSGLYGPSIAEHTFGLLTMLARKLQVAQKQQQSRLWEPGLAKAMFDLRGRTLGLVGLGNIGQSIARLGQAYGMRTVGCRRVAQPTPFVDRVYPLSELRDMLREVDALVLAAPLTPTSTGLLGPAEFACCKPGSLFINISRGPIADEAALLASLESGQLAGAGLDVFAVEPLPEQHPFWHMPQVILTPHVSGEPVNLSAQPGERFLRNLHAFTQGLPLEGQVKLELGY